MPTGYTRDKSFLVTVVDIVRELKQQNSRLVYGRRGLSPTAVGLNPGRGAAGGRLASFLWAPLLLPQPVSTVCAGLLGM